MKTIIEAEVPEQSCSGLHPARVCSTITVLAQPIQERFPGSGLSRVAAELIRVANQNQQVVEHLRKPLTILDIAAPEVAPLPPTSAGTVE